MVYTILPSGTPPYTIEVEYTVTGGSATVPCATTTTVATIVITGATETGYDLPDAWCAEGDFDLSAYTAVGGGEWTLITVGAGTIAGSIYTPAADFTGLVQIDYQPAAGGCGSPSTEFMWVYAPVDATLDPSPGVEFCLGSADLPFDLNNYTNAGATPGGTWTSSGPDATAVSGTTFNPSLPGVYVLTYSVSNGVCSDSESIVVTVYPALDSTIEDITVCESPSGTINLSAMMTPSTTGGGTFSIGTLTGVASATLSPSGAQLVYTILPSGTPPYTIEVEYTVTGGSATVPCATTTTVATIVITGATETGYDLPDAWCAEGDFDLSAYTAVGGGEWTLITVGAGTIAGSIYTPAADFTGLVQIDYQPAAGGCGSPSTEFMWVYAPVDATLDSSPGVEFCLGSADLPFDLNNYTNAGATPGGTWTSSGPDATAVSGTTFNPSLPGVYVLTYSVSNGVCSDSESIVVTVYPALDSTIEDITVCESPSGTINLSAMMTPSTTGGGTFSIGTLTGVASATLSPSGTQLVYTILPSGTPPYTIEVEYTVTGGSATVPCATTTTVATIVITGATETGYDLPDAWCAEGDFDLSAYTAVGGGEWTLITVGAGTIAGSIYTPAADFTGLVQIDYQPAARWLLQPEY
ncbi:MAG: hypothetical protein IPM47_02795 [Sphingobacteriales bacterium]|nr:MAG: hypothetical protein IPM47_02795 [Sphingobacteriales bacterium]